MLRFGRQLDATDECIVFDGGKSDGDGAIVCCSGLELPDYRAVGSSGGRYDIKRGEDLLVIDADVKDTDAGLGPVRFREMETNRVGGMRKQVRK